MLPLAARVTAAVAWWLSSHMGEVVELRPDPDQVRPLPPNAISNGKAHRRAGFLSDAEKRVHGLPAVAED
ncbi:MAG: hypothetical protein R3D53_11985 [Paracoccaceae bacterium]